jgi:radical SAM protein with 4Fe4S-binding SPASM domain
MDGRVYKPLQPQLPGCTRRLVEFHEQDMNLDFYGRLVNNNPQLESVWPHVFGEPLLHPDICEFIRYAKCRQIATSLSTNVTLLDEERGRCLLDSGLDYLVLPVDGVSATTYETNRYPASFAEIERRIETFLKMKLEKRARLHVAVQMVRMRNNNHEVRAFRRKWKRAGVDSVRVRDDLSGLPGVSLRSGKSRKHMPRSCFFLWRGPLCVQAAGTVIPCPYYHGSEPFGDLRKQTTLEAWNSEPMAQLRAAHQRRDFSRYPICARCPRHQPYPALASLSFFITTWHIRRILPKLEHIQRVLGWKLVE